jgi:hypothetical protein
VFGMIATPRRRGRLLRIEATTRRRSPHRRGRGREAIWQDLRARLYVSENELKAHYLSSPAWLKD